MTDTFGLDYDYTETGKRSDGLMSDMPIGSRHFELTISNPANGQTMTVEWSQGPGIMADPELPAVLDALASDAAGFENTDSLTDWAREYGYSDNVGLAVSTFEAVKQQSEDLRRLLGDAEYDRLLWHTERE
jgi:hypothetical protein